MLLVKFPEVKSVAEVKLEKIVMADKTELKNENVHEENQRNEENANVNQFEK